MKSVRFTVRNCWRALVLFAVLTIVNGLLTFGPTSSARAADGGYPDATMACIWPSYNTAGYCKKDGVTTYEWGTRHNDEGSIYSSRGYTYRNCTDYVAWKLQSLGVADGWTRGLGNGGDWYNKAANKGLSRGTVPKAGAVAIIPSNAPGYGGYGHVAYVESLNPGGTITVSEYNLDLSGGYSVHTGTPSAMGFTEFVYFGDKMSNSLGEPDAPPPSTSNYILRLKKRSFGSAQQVWTATKSAVYVDVWWPGSNGVIHTKVYTAKANEQIVDFDKINQPDGVTQNLYVATNATDGSSSGGVYEVWWNGGGYSAPAKLLARSGIRRVVVDLQQSGNITTHRLYVLGQDGPYEYWWRDDTKVSDGFRLWNISGGIDIIKNVGVDGKDEVFVATSGTVYSIKWPVNGDVQRKVVAQLNGTVGITLQNRGTTELLYTATKTSVHETWWNTDTPEGWFSDPAKIITAPGSETVVSVQERLYDGVQHIYLATTGNVYRYLNGGGEFGNPALLAGVYPSTVTAIDASLDPANGDVRQVYVAHKSFVLEQYWSGSAGTAQGSEPVVSLGPGE